MGNKSTTQSIVTETMVQAAIAAMWEKNTGRTFDPERSMIAEGLRDEVRAALEAVAPLIAAETERAMFDDWGMRSVADVRADALEEAASDWAADPDAVGDTPADARNWLRDRAAAERAGFTVPRSNELGG